MTDKNKKLNVPKHIGLAISGNRRWASERNLPLTEGYAKAFEKIGQMPEWFFSRGINLVSVFAFPAAYWSRPVEEVNFIMKVFKKLIETKLIEQAEKNNFKVVVSGKIDELPGDLPELCNSIMEKTIAGQKGILNLVFNYSGRQEITDAIHKILKNKIDISQVHEGMIRKYLYQGDFPDLDAIVYTSDEKNFSGLNLWQSVGSEQIYLKKYWPDFEEQDVDTVITDFVKRKV